MLMPFEFERIASTSTTEVSRAKVPGGWIVYTLTNAPHSNSLLTSIFVAEPEHLWEI